MAKFLANSLTFLRSTFPEPRRGIFFYLKIISRFKSVGILEFFIASHTPSKISLLHSMSKTICSPFFSSSKDVAQI